MANAPQQDEKLRLVIFGSRGNGTNRRNSDIDVIAFGSAAEIERIKARFDYLAIEQGGPLDLFVIGSVDNDVDLIAAFGSPADPRVVLVGDVVDLDEILAQSFDVTEDNLMKLCEEIDHIWNETSSIDRLRQR